MSRQTIASEDDGLGNKASGHPDFDAEVVVRRMFYSWTDDNPAIGNAVIRIMA